MADLVGVHLAAGAPAIDQRLPFALIDAADGRRRDGVTIQLLLVLLFVDGANLATTPLP